MLGAAALFGIYILQSYIGTSQKYENIISDI